LARQSLDTLAELCLSRPIFLQISYDSYLVTLFETVPNTQSVSLVKIFKAGVGTTYTQTATGPIMEFHCLAISYQKLIISSRAPVTNRQTQCTTIALECGDAQAKRVGLSIHQF